MGGLRAKILSCWGRAIRPGMNRGEVVMLGVASGDMSAFGAFRMRVEGGKCQGDLFGRKPGARGST